FLDHLGKVFECHVSAGSGIVETAIGVFLDHHRFILDGHSLPPWWPAVLVRLRTPLFQDRLKAVSIPSALCSAAAAPARSWMKVAPRPGNAAASLRFPV